MKIMRIFQNIFLGISLGVLAILPLAVAFGDVSGELVGKLYLASFTLVVLVMLVRPLADIFPSVKFLRKMVYFRKGLGVLSASIIVGFMIGKIIAPGSNYLASIFTQEYWSLENYNFFAHIGDVTGFILLITSNNFSMMLLKKNWKRIQKMSYIYFFAGGIYEVAMAKSTFALVAMIIVGIITISAFIMKKLDI